MAIGPVFLCIQGGLSSQLPSYELPSTGFLVLVTRTWVRIIWILWSKLLWFDVLQTNIFWYGFLRWATRPTAPLLVLLWLEFPWPIISAQESWSPLLKFPGPDLSDQISSNAILTEAFFTRAFSTQAAINQAFKARSPDPSSRDLSYPNLIYLVRTSLAQAPLPQVSYSAIGSLSLFLDFGL